MLFGKEWVSSWIIVLSLRSCCLSLSSWWPHSLSCQFLFEFFVCSLYLEVFFLKSILGSLSAFIKIGAIHFEWRPNTNTNKNCLLFSVGISRAWTLPSLLKPPPQCIPLDCLAGAAQWDVKAGIVHSLVPWLVPPYMGSSLSRLRIPSPACL